MSDHLKQLMLEAGYAAPELAGRANKLAELIVFECIKIAIFNGNIKTGKAIKEHFGLIYD